MVVVDPMSPIALVYSVAPMVFLDPVALVAPESLVAPMAPMALVFPVVLVAHLLVLPLQLQIMNNIIYNTISLTMLNAKNILKL